MVKQFSYSQALLAVAIAFLALSLFQFTLQIPSIINVIDKTTSTVDSVHPNIEQIIQEVALVRIEVGKVREVVDQQTPKILAQVEATRPVVQQVVKESEHYSQKIPDLLAQMTKIEQQIKEIQTAIPGILKGVDDLVSTTNNTTKEIARWRPHSTEYLKEIELSRAYIPEYLTRLENIITDAKTVGSAASSGLVSGLFSGVIRLPLDMVAGLTNIVDKDSISAKKLTAKDIEVMQKTLIGLLNDDFRNKSVWKNTESGNRGVMIKGKETKRDNKKCFNITFNNTFSNDKETLNETMCINKKGIWEVS